MLSLLSSDLLAALSWDPNIKGGLYVVIAFVVLCGSPYLLLATNSGARLGFLLAGAGLFGFMLIIGVVWWVYGIGPKGRTPTWKPQTTVTGEPAQVTAGPLAAFPEGWHKLELTDKKVADAQPVIDGVLTGGEEGGGLFEASSEYEVVGAYGKGGESYGPLGLDFRPFNLFHKANYLTIQVAPVAEEDHAAEGEAPPAPPEDQAAEGGASPSEPAHNVQPVSVVLLRDLGSLRLNPAIATIASALIFGLFVNQLHVRDKEAMAKAAAAGSPVTTS